MGTTALWVLGLIFYQVQTQLCLPNGGGDKCCGVGGRSPNYVGGCCSSPVGGCGTSCGNSCGNSCGKSCGGYSGSCGGGCNGGRSGGCGCASGCGTCDTGCSGSCGGGCNSGCGCDSCCNSDCKSGSGRGGVCGGSCGYGCSGGRGCDSGCGGGCGGGCGNGYGGGGGGGCGCGFDKGCCSGSGCSTGCGCDICCGSGRGSGYDCCCGSGGNSCCNGGSGCGCDNGCGCNSGGGCDCSGPCSPCVVQASCSPSCECAQPCCPSFSLQATPCINVPTCLPCGTQVCNSYGIQVPACSSCTIQSLEPPCILPSCGIPCSSCNCQPCQCNVQIPSCNVQVPPCNIQMPCSPNSCGMQAISNLGSLIQTCSNNQGCGCGCGSNSGSDYSPVIDNTLAITLANALQLLIVSHLLENSNCNTFSSGDCNFPCGNVIELLTPDFYCQPEPILEVPCYQEPDCSSGNPCGNIICDCGFNPCGAFCIDSCQVNPFCGAFGYDNVCSPMAAEVMFPAEIPAQLLCSFGYKPANVPCVSVNVEPCCRY